MSRTAYLARLERERLLTLERRAEARARKGWIMDIYLLRRRTAAG